METAVNECPSCHKKDIVQGEPVTRHAYTEIYVACHCPDCGYSFWIVYHPDRTEDRE